MKKYNVNFPLFTQAWKKSLYGDYYIQDYYVGDQCKVDIQPTIDQILQLQKDNVYGLFTKIKDGFCFICANKNYPTIDMNVPGIIWEKDKNLNITYDADGGFFSNNRKTINDIIYKMEDGKIVLSAPLWGYYEDAHREGYDFLYWSPINVFDDEPTNERFELNENINKDTYLKAIWKKHAGKLLEKESWYLGKTDKSLITEINIVDFYELEEGYKLVESWAADSTGFNYVNCYIQSNDSDQYKLVIAGNGSGQIDLASDITNMFINFNNVINISGFNIFNSSSTQYMKGMFQGCSSLVSLDLTGFDFDVNLDFTNFCMGCTSLKTIKFDNLASANRFTKMISMFKDCISLTEITFPSNFNFSNVLAANFAFYNCSSLISINFPKNYNFNKIIQMNSIFYNCFSLKDLDLTGFNTKNITLKNNYKNCFTNTSLYSFSIGENWNINFSEAGLSAPLLDVSDGFWYDVNTNIGYSVDSIPINVKATYTSVAPTV